MPRSYPNAQFLLVQGRPNKENYAVVWQRKEKYNADQKKKKKKNTMKM